VWDSWQPLPAPPVPPRSGATVRLPFSAQELSRQLGERCRRRGVSPPLGSALLEVRAVLRADCAWAPAGHVVHSAQLPLPDAVLADAAAAGAAAAAAEAARLLDDGGDELTVQERADGGVDVAGGALAASISGATGCITRLALRGSDLLAAPLEPCLFRAATDNDRGGSGGTSYAARWLAAGLDRLAPVAGSCRLRVERRSASCVAVSAEWLLRPQAPQDGAAGATAISEVGGAHWFAQQEGQREGGEGESGGGGAPRAAAAAEAVVSCAATYELRASGVVRTRWTIDARGALPAQLAQGLTASLPRVGLRTCVPAAFGHAMWHGRGPHECYPDRKASGALRQFSATVGELHVPHIFPQECGARCDARWLQLAPGGGGGAGGLAVLACGAPMLFSASRFSLEELFRATHNHLLRADPGGRLHVHLDAAHMGVGGDDSWSPSVHEPYLLPPRAYAFELVLAPGAGGERAEEAWKALNR